MTDNQIIIIEPKPLTTPTRSNYAMLSNVIETAVDLQPRTKQKYLREIEKAKAADVNLFNPQELREYALGLCNSSRSFLKAAIGRLVSGQINDVKAQITPDNYTVSMAAIARMEATLDAVKVVKAKGQKTHSWLTADQLSELIKLPDTTPRGHRDKLALLLLGDCGLRRDEAIRAKYSDIKRQGKTPVLSVIGKGDKARTVPLAEHTVKQIEVCKNLVGGEYLLAGFDKWDNITTAMGGSTLYNLVNDYGKLIDHPTLAPHDLRRTFARVRYDAGMPLDQIKVLLGHSSLETTKRYLGISIDLAMTSKAYINIS